MRYVTLGCNNGTYRLYQVLLFIFLRGLQLSSGRVVHIPQGRYEDLAVRLRDLRLSQKDQAPMGDTSSALPVLRDLGFIPRGRDIVTPVPREVRVTDRASTEYGSHLARRRNESLVDQRLDALLDKALRRNVSHFDGRLGAEPPSHNQMPVPHLDRLGFGVANSRRSGIFTGDAAHVSPQSSMQERSESLKKLVVVGLGSFIGGISVIGVLLLVVFLRCRHRLARPTGSDDVEAKPEGPKPCRESIDVLPATTADMGHEFSTSSYTSGSTETSSSSSDNVSRTGSETGDMWTTPGQIALCALPPRVRRHRVTFADELEAAADFDVLDYQSNDVCEQPDLLLDITPSVYMTTAHPQEAHHGVEYVSEEGGIVAVPNSNIVMVVPPGAVSDHRIEVSVKVHGASTFPRVKLSLNEAVTSSVIELVAPGLEYFSKPVTLTFPYRSLPTASQCLCENDPLCNCTGSRMELRLCDTSTSPSAPWTPIPVQSLAPRGHYDWPECLSLEGANDDDVDLLDLTAPDLSASLSEYVKCECSDSVSRVRTRVPGLYCLVHVGLAAERSGSWTAQSWSTSSSLSSGVSRQPRVRLCVGVAARYHWERERDGDYGGPGAGRALEEVQYTVYLGDNTTDGRQRMSDVMSTSGSHKECEFLPLDVAVGCDVILTLRSVFDSDWAWELPYDSPKKTIYWTQICGDFGSLATAEFRCLPKDDEVCSSDSEQRSVVSIFDVGVSECGPDTPSPESMTMVANSTF